MPEIELIRGDTETIEINFKKDDMDYKPNDLENGDIFTFTIRDRFTNEVEVKKRCIYPELKIELLHEETKRLRCETYNFDLEYRKADASIVKTLIIGLCHVKKDVTYD